MSPGTQRAGLPPGNEHLVALNASSKSGLLFGDATFRRAFATPRLCNHDHGVAGTRRQPSGGLAIVMINIIQEPQINVNRAMARARGAGAEVSGEAVGLAGN